MKTKKYILFIAIICFIAFLVSEYFIQFMLIQGNSMTPTYHNMQLVILDKHSSSYTYGDVIAFQCEGFSSVLVKRIVACPGDTVQIKNKTLYVNNKPANMYTDIMEIEYSGLLEREVILKEDEFIVLGDNLAESKDSRYQEVGIIIKNTIVGKIL